MTIRTRLALQFLLLASIILGSAFLVVYAFSADYRQEEFMARLKDRGTNTAKLLIQVDEVDELLLAKIEEDNPVRLPEEDIAIYDHHDHLIFRLGVPSGPPCDSAFLDRVRLEEELRDGTGVREQVAFLFSDRYDRFVVVASGHDVYGRRKVRNLGNVLIATFLIGLVLIFLVGGFYAQRAMSPVQQLIDEIRAISAANLSQRAQTGNDRDELAQLALTFNDLLDRLQTAFLSQKHFIANASHELRTPLTAISGQLDVLLLRTREPEEYTKAVRSIRDDMYTLNRLADRLLLMAQVEHRGPASTFGPVRMDEVLWQARSEVLRADPANQVEVAMDSVEDEKDLLVLGNENLLRSLVANLIENACKYSPDRVARVRLEAGGEQVRIRVEDRGIGIPAEDQERIFEPFVRLNNTGGAKGHGIGLSLARHIADLHRGIILVRSTVCQGSSFTVELPKAA